MDDMNAMVQAGKEVVDLCDKSLSLLDKFHFLPLFGFRKKNMLDRQSLQLEMDEKRQAHIMKMEIENTRVRLALEGMEQCQAIALEAVKRDLDQGESFEKAMIKNDPSAVLATSYVFREALEGQYARERVGMYALAEALDTPDTKSSSEEPGATWTSRFMKYVSDLRDEEVFKLWGKILAGEIRKPGSFSLKTLEILHTLDSRDAEIFNKIAPYVINSDFIPEEAFAKTGVQVFKAATLESLGLTIRHMQKAHRGLIVGLNRHFLASQHAQPNFAQSFNFPCNLLTPAGRELYALVELSEEDSRHGMELFSDIAKQRFKIDLQIAPLSARN